MNKKLTMWILVTIFLIMIGTLVYLLPESNSNQVTGMVTGMVTSEQTIEYYDTISDDEKAYKDAGMVAVIKQGDTIKDILISTLDGATDPFKRLNTGTSDLQKYQDKIDNSKWKPYQAYTLNSYSLQGIDRGSSLITSSGRIIPEGKTASQVVVSLTGTESGGGGDGPITSGTEASAKVETTSEYTPIDINEQLNLGSATSQELLEYYKNKENKDFQPIWAALTEGKGYIKDKKIYIKDTGGQYKSTGYTIEKLQSDSINHYIVENLHSSITQEDSTLEFENFEFSDGEKFTVVKKKDSEEILYYSDDDFKTISFIDENNEVKTYNYDNRFGQIIEPAFNSKDEFTTQINQKIKVAPIQDVPASPFAPSDITTTQEQGPVNKIYRNAGEAHKPPAEFVKDSKVFFEGSQKLFHLQKQDGNVYTYKIDGTGSYTLIRKRNAQGQDLSFDKQTEIFGGGEHGTINYGQDGKPTSTTLHRTDGKEVNIPEVFSPAKLGQITDFNEEPGEGGVLFEYYVTGEGDSETKTSYGNFIGGAIVKTQQKDEDGEWIPSQDVKIQLTGQKGEINIQNDLVSFELGEKDKKTFTRFSEKGNVEFMIKESKVDDETVKNGIITIKDSNKNTKYQVTVQEGNTEVKSNFKNNKIEQPQRIITYEQDGKTSKKTTTEKRYKDKKVTRELTVIEHIDGKKYNQQTIETKKGQIKKDVIKERDPKTGKFTGVRTTITHKYSEDGKKEIGRSHLKIDDNGKPISGKVIEIKEGQETTTDYIFDDDPEKNTLETLKAKTGTLTKAEQELKSQYTEQIRIYKVRRSGAQMDYWVNKATQTAGLGQRLSTLLMPEFTARWARDVEKFLTEELFGVLGGIESVTTNICKDRIKKAAETVVIGYGCDGYIRTAPILQGDKYGPYYNNIFSYIAGEKYGPFPKECTHDNNCSDDFTCTNNMCKKDDTTQQEYLYVVTFKVDPSCSGAQPEFNVILKKGTTSKNLYKNNRKTKGQALIASGNETTFISSNDYNKLCLKFANADDLRITLEGDEQCNKFNYEQSYVSELDSIDTFLGGLFSFGSLGDRPVVVHSGQPVSSEQQTTSTSQSTSSDPTSLIPDNI